MSTNSNRPQPAVWFPTIKCNTGADIFTKTLCEGLNNVGIKAKITWLPKRAEYAPWTVPAVTQPQWANLVHVNTWLHQRFWPKNLPVVATMHHCVHVSDFAPYKSFTQKLYHRLWIYLIERSALREANRIVAVSHYTAHNAGSIFNVRDIKVIYNGIDLHEPFIPIERQKPYNPFRLIYVGSWTIRKGVDLLKPIMQHLGKDFELYYTGGELSNMPQNMKPLGHPATSKALAEKYREADALLFPSRLEGFGLVALEAQACGLPVIATKNSALLEVVDDGVTGILCRQDDIKEFVNAAKLLAKNHTLWLRMGKAARQRVVHFFGIDKMIQKYINIYEELC